MSFARLLVFSVLLIGLSDLMAQAAPPDHARRPDCAMTGSCDRASRTDLICSEDRCRAAPPNWIDVVLENGSGGAPGGFAPPPDPTVIPLPGMGFGILIGLGLLFGLRMRA